jgi:chorismate mutase
MAKLTTEEFIAKAKAVHGDRYDYSRVEYVLAKICRYE